MSVPHDKRSYTECYLGDANDDGLLFYAARKMKMSLAAINTILNTAPVIIQGASKLISLIKNRGAGAESKNDAVPETLDGLQQEINRIQQRLDATDNSNVEQIKLIEELARQNASLAGSLKKTVGQLNLVTAIAILATVIAIISLVLRFMH